MRVFGANSKVTCRRDTKTFTHHYTVRKNHRGFFTIGMDQIIEAIFTAKEIFAVRAGSTRVRHHIVVKGFEYHHRHKTLDRHLQTKRVQFQGRLPTGLAVQQADPPC